MENFDKGGGEGGGDFSYWVVGTEGVILTTQIFVEAKNSIQ